MNIENLIKDLGFTLNKYSLNPEDITIAVSEDLLPITFVSFDLVPKVPNFIPVPHVEKLIVKELNLVGDHQSSDFPVYTFREDGTLSVVLKLREPMLLG